MESIKRKVLAARRRLMLVHFCRLLCWTLTAGWFMAAMAIVIRATGYWPQLIGDFSSRDWAIGWIAGASLLAIVGSLITTWVRRPSLTAVASDIDGRFGIKERLSSALAMTDQDRSSAMGAALLQDAARRAEQLAIGEKFAFRPTRLGLLPLVPALLIAAVLAIGPAVIGMASPRLTAEQQAQVDQVRKATESLKKKIREQREKAEAKGLEDATELFAKLEANLEKIEKQKVDQKDAMIAINDLKKQLEERKQELGASDSMQKALSQLNESQKGPADSLVKAIKEGELAEAKQQAKQLVDQLKNGSLSDKQKEELKQQLQQMQQQMKKAVEEHEAKKQQLQQQIEQAKQSGNQQEADKLQQQLDQAEAQNGQMQKMQQMAESMQKAAQAMEQGDSEGASEAIQDMADELGEMQASDEQLQEIEEALDQISQSKQQMRCEKCSGAGCKDCQGQDQGQGQGQGKGKDGKPGGDSDNGRGGTKYGLGKGSGESGPEDNTEGQSYESKVKGDAKAGRGLNAGYADGPNRKGVTREEIKQAVLSGTSDESDPLDGQVLPRAERDHTQEYFDRLRQKE